MSMVTRISIDEQLLTSLDETVIQAAQFFSGVDESLCDGHQTAREVLSHLVFWHQEYAAVIEALTDGRQPILRQGAFATLNAQATRAYQTVSLLDLARRLLSTQDRLDVALRRLPDWEMNFPVKEGGRFWSVTDRVVAIESHIRNHVARLRRVQRHSPAWWLAYDGVKRWQ
jgi:hypothetical protein